MKIMRKLFRTIKSNMKVASERGMMCCTGCIPLYALNMK